MPASIPALIARPRPTAGGRPRHEDKSPMATVTLYNTAIANAFAQDGPVAKIVEIKRGSDPGQPDQTHSVCASRSGRFIAVAQRRLLAAQCPLTA